ncbi:MAG TPA: ABC transporter permease, partial [Vicinamibacterales bacterium]|nr:ABC transporter permease [Vicinamibacterales bacterium]
MRSDIVLALRRLRRAPIFTLFSIVTLALAIGVVTAVYSLIRSGLRTELSIGDASSVVMIAKRSSMTDALYPASLSWPDYQDLIQQTDVFQSTAAWTTFTNALVVGDSSEIVFGELVSGDYFATIGLHAERGRLIDSGDDRPGAPAVAVLSASAWRRRFARDPRAVGSTIRLAGRPFEVIGIAPESFRGLRPLVRFASPDVWVPLSHARALAPSWARQDRGRRDHTWLNVVGRLSAGRQMADAERQVQMLSDRIDAAEPLPDLGVGNGTYVKQQRHWYAL